MISPSIEHPKDEEGKDVPCPRPGSAADFEIARLRNEVVVQARELSIARWQIGTLLGEQSSFRAGAMRLLQRLPRLATTLTRLRRIVGRKTSTRSYRRSDRGDVTSIAVGENLQLHFPFMVIGDDRSFRQLAGQANSHGMTQVMPGAGLVANLPLAPADAPTLRSPQAGSFVEWLIDGRNCLREMNTIVVDAGDEISLGLLRGRLASHQVLSLTSTTNERCSLAAELGHPAVVAADVSVYTQLPENWLDPLDQNGQPLRGRTGIRWPKISVVMVSFNQAAYLEEGLRSILDQGYPDLEFLVVDGNSTDGSIEILERYRDRLDYLLIEPDNGQADGLNKGFSRATGNILTWVNSDDLLEPGALFRVAQAFQAHQTDMVVGGCVQIGRNKSEILRRHHTKLPYGFPLALPLGLLLEMDRFWQTASFFYQPEVFFSRDIWERSGGGIRTDLNYVLDYDLWVRMAAAGAAIVHIPDFLACSRTHEQQKTTVGMPYLPEVKQLLREYSERLLNKSPVRPPL